LSDSNKFGTRAPGTLAVPEFHKVGPPPPGSPSTLCFRICLRKLPALVTGNAWQVIDAETFLHGLDFPESLPERAALSTLMTSTVRSTLMTPPFDTPDRASDGSCCARAPPAVFAKRRRPGNVEQLFYEEILPDLGATPPAYYGLLEQADESCWFFSRTSAASSFWTGCPCTRARRASNVSVRGAH
jgi:hypothetical protein